MPRFGLGVTCLLGGFSIGLGSCGEPAPGRIEGDVYLAEDPLSEQSLANIEVRLVEDGLHVDSLLLKICPDTGRAIAADTAARRAAWQTRSRILSDYILQTTTADSGASFVLDSVPRGRYRLWADTVIGDRSWTWRTRVFVPGRGDTTHMSLTNSNADDDPFLCYVDRRTELGER
jgi:hypothetical protein